MAEGFSTPKTDFTAGQLAFALWIVPIGDNHARVYFASAGKRLDEQDGSVETVAAIGRTLCKMKGGRIARGCVIVAKGRQIPDDAFEIDPDLSSAQLTLKQE